MILAASVLVVAGLTTPNPVVVKSDNLFERPNIVRGVLRITRNPFFWGVGLFAIAHVIMTGHISGLLAFGSVGFLGLAGGPVLDAKKARRHGPTWDFFAAATSNIPFLAIAQGRQRLPWREIGIWRGALAICVFLAALLFHQALFGGNPLAILRDAALVTAKLRTEGRARRLGIGAALVRAAEDTARQSGKAGTASRPSCHQTNGVWFAGPRFKVSFNGKALLEVEDGTFSERGMVGLWTKADGVTLFSNFVYGQK